MVLISGHRLCATGGTYVEGVFLADFASHFIISNDVDLVDKVETISIEMIEVFEIVSLNRKQTTERTPYLC
jgi:hypothetical protein